MSVAVSARPVLRVVEHHFLVYRRTWRGTVFTKIFSQLRFLAAIGVWLGTFVDEANPAGIEGLGYLAFLSPGLLVALAIQTASFESTFPVMAGIRWLKTYVAMILSPLQVWHVGLGQLLWVGLRSAFGATVFVFVMVVFDAVQLQHAPALVVVATITGFAFAAPIQGFSATQTGDANFANLFRFVIMPMFIFSGTFFPISQLPELLQLVAVATPLWHAVSLSRGIALETLEPGLALVNLAYLLTMTAAGAVWSVRTFSRKLAE